MSQHDPDIAAEAASKRTAALDWLRLDAVAEAANIVMQFAYATAEAADKSDTFRVRANAALTSHAVRQLLSVAATLGKSEVAT